MTDILGRAAREHFGLTRTRCHATTSAGEPCRLFCAPGHLVCYWHGGKTPQAERVARQRLALLVEPALEVLFKALNSDGVPDANTIRAAQIVLDRAGFGASSSVVVDNASPDLTYLSDEDLETRAVEMLKRIRAARSGARPEEVTVVVCVERKGVIDAVSVAAHEEAL